MTITFASTPRIVETVGIEVVNPLQAGAWLAVWCEERGYKDAPITYVCHVNKRWEFVLYSHDPNRVFDARVDMFSNVEPMFLISD